MKQSKIVMAGTGKVLLGILDNICECCDINIVGVVLDKTVSEEKIEWFERQIKERKIRMITFEDLSYIKPDAIFACEYTKIIDAKLVKEYLFINMHAGILPVYRGNNANAWAIMNGASEVGYTIHRMNEVIDGGDTYYIHRMKIEKEQTYGDVHDELIQHMIQNTGRILDGILKGDLKPCKQEGGYILCEHFRRKDGEIKNFDVDSSFLYNLYRCFAKPLGTGIYFFYKGNKYETKRVRCGIYYGVLNYVAFSGRIVNITEDEIWIKTRDNIICFGEIVDYNEKEVSMKLFKIGSSVECE